MALQPTEFTVTRDFYRTKQMGKSLEDFENAQELVLQANVDIVDEDLLKKEKDKDASIIDEDVRQKYAAMAFFMNADVKRFGGLWDQLHNSLLQGGARQLPYNYGRSDPHDDSLEE
ncbi:predicted protein [Chaetoceros tenuissimus]|uniref:Uncharacterized protein n=1 Tax=Chaetoceros tenuissimus TaxID=426638 RepID=A0AAD3HB08_9STRA|nr:predicted protein [Chaetoceros tenuissimus]